MKTMTLAQLITPSLTVVLFLATACTTSNTEAPAKTESENHEAHHPEIQTAQKDDKGGMMGKEKMDQGMMDSKQMKGMMDHCMADQKDGKSCQHQMMEKCQEKMNAKECTKMMNEVKK